MSPAIEVTRCLNVHAARTPLRGLVRTGSSTTLKSVIASWELMLTTGVWARDWPRQATNVTAVSKRRPMMETMCLKVGILSCLSTARGWGNPAIKRPRALSRQHVCCVVKIAKRLIFSYLGHF